MRSIIIFDLQIEINRMNKSYFAGTLLLVLFFISCKNDPGADEPKDFHLAVADSILHQYNANRYEWDRAEKLEGPVDIMAKDSVLTVEFNPDNGIERITYFLQTDKKTKGLKNGLSGRAEVIFLDRNVIVNFLDTKKIIFLSIETDRDPSYLASLENVMHYKGYGLGERKINKTNLNGRAPICSCDPIVSKVALCNSGGLGELSCRVANADGSCRVSCSGQTFACCDKKME